jgi:hypothetical protein
MSRSAMTGKSMAIPDISSRSFTQARWAWMESMERPMSWTPSSSNAFFLRAKARNSVEQTGVKSAGWLKSTTHLPLKSESRISPRVVLAVKSGAGSFKRGRVGTSFSSINTSCWPEPAR